MTFRAVLQPNGVTRVSPARVLVSHPASPTTTAAPRESVVVPKHDGMTWRYGITTVPSRREGLLPKTLASLAAAGFDRPRLFVDGCDSDALYRHFGLDLTMRYPAVRPFPNWYLSMLELWLRDPHADRYALFQDDVIAVKNLRQYLEQSWCPPKGYQNLYSFPHIEGGDGPNYLGAKADRPKEQGGWFVTKQTGKGALGLVFTGEAVRLLLGHPDMVGKIRDKGVDGRGWRNLDGAIVNALSHSLGWKEYCHSPSLLQHTGCYNKSTMADFVPGASVHEHPQATSFPGEEFDALSLLEGTA